MLSLELVRRHKFHRAFSPGIDPGNYRGCLANLPVTRWSSYLAGLRGMPPIYAKPPGWMGRRVANLPPCNSASPPAYYLKHLDYLGHTSLKSLTWFNLNGKGPGFCDRCAGNFYVLKPLSRVTLCPGSNHFMIMLLMVAAINCALSHP